LCYGVRFLIISTTIIATTAMTIHIMLHLVIILSFHFIKTVLSFFVLGYYNLFSV